MKTETEKDRALYEFALLDKYTGGKRLLIRIAGWVIYLTILLVGHTLRFETMKGWDKFEVGSWEAFEGTKADQTPVILGFWHDRIFLLIYLLRKIRGHVMISKSFDGEYIARAVQRIGYGVIRGSANKRSAVSALARMIKLAKRGKRLGLTVDGPKGPRHKSKKGAIVLAQKSGLPVIPLIVEAKNRWILNTWDKTHIPVPFSRVKVFWGDPIEVPMDADETMIEEKQAELDNQLDELVIIAKEWRVADKK